MKLRFTLPTVLMATLLLATACRNGNNDNKDRYATNKAGERLVEKIESIYEHNKESRSTLFSYNVNNIATRITEISPKLEEDGFRAEILTIEINQDSLFCKIVFDTNYPSSNLIEAESWSCHLNKKGFIDIDKGWTGSRNYRLSYDENDYLQDVYKDDELLKTFKWEDGNISNPDFQYTDHSKQANMDWSAWNYNFQSYDEGINTPSLDVAWKFSISGFLGTKNKDLLISDNRDDHGYKYTYEFDKDGFVSIIKQYSEDGSLYCTSNITYLKK